MAMRSGTRIISMGLRRLTGYPVRCLPRKDKLLHRYFCEEDGEAWRDT